MLMCKLVKYILFVLPIILSGQQSYIFNISFLESSKFENKEEKKTNFEYKTESLIFEVNDLTDTVLVGEYQLKIELLEKSWSKSWKDEKRVLDKDSLIVSFNLNSRISDINEFLKYMDNSLLNSKDYIQERIDNFIGEVIVDTIRNVSINSLSSLFFQRIEDFEEELFLNFQLSAMENELVKKYKRDSLAYYLESQLAYECRYRRVYQMKPLFWVRWKRKSDSKWNSLIKVMDEPNASWDYQNVFSHPIYRIIDHDLDRLIMHMLPYSFSKRSNLLDYYKDSSNLISLVIRFLEERCKIERTKK